MGKTFFQIRSDIPLDEIQSELLHYRKDGIYAYCEYKGVLLDTNLSEEELAKKIDMLKLGMTEEEYDKAKKEEKNKNYIIKILSKKMSADPITRFWIGNVHLLLPYTLKAAWEYDCYYELACGFMGKEDIKNIAFIIMSLFTEKDESILFNRIEMAFFLLKDSKDPNNIIKFLKKYAPRQDFLERYVYCHTNTISPDSERYQSDFESFYNYAFPQDNQFGK